MTHPHMNAPQTHRHISKCPVGCSCELIETQLLLPEGVLLQCSECGQLVSQCTEDRYWQSMEEFNDPHGTLPNERSIERRFRRNKKFLDQICKLLGRPPENIRLLDVGCSSGAFVETGVQLGYLAEGVEPAPKAAATAQAAGLKVRQGLLHEAGYADEEFDAITLFEVIEHLKDPLPLLKECQRILRPGGILLIGTGNTASWSARTMGSRWAYFSIAAHGGHISFFNPSSLQKLARQAGFSLSRLKTRSVRFCDKAQCSEPLYTLLKIIAELCTPIATLFNRGEDMAMYFRRD